MRLSLLVSFLLLSSTALADQAYVQASPWAVNYLPVMPGQNPHQRCILQSTYSGEASLQFISEGKMIQGAIVILTEPVFQEPGRSIDVTVVIGKQGWEFPAQTLSKYAVAIEISDAYESMFRAALNKGEPLVVKSGFKNFAFSMVQIDQALEDALACVPPAPPKPVAPPPVAVAAAPVPPSPLTPLPPEKPAPAAVTEVQKTTTTVTTPAAPVAPVAHVAQGPQTFVGGVREGVGNQAYFVKDSGKDVALSDALPRILPPDYKFVFTQGASPSERVTWDKGGDWLETLIIALDDVGLQAAATGKTVTVLPKLKATTMAVVSSERASVIVKEPGALKGMGVDAPPLDPSKPPSPGLQREANALLNDLRLDEAALLDIARGPDGRMQPIDDDGNIVPMPVKPDVDKPVVTKPPEPKTVADPLAAAKPDVSPPPAPTGPNVFTARKGEKVQDVFARWGQQDNVDLDLDLQRDYFLASDITVQGDIELAVEKALVQFQDMPDMPRIDTGSEGNTADTGGAGGSVVGGTMAAPPVAPENAAVERRLGLIAGWNAVQGTSLRAALTNWTRQSQMRLVWESPEDLIVSQSVSGTQRMEDALDQLLSQYDSAPQKPVIRINHDRDTGQTAMIVDVEGSAAAAPQEPKKAPAKSKK